MRYTVLFSPESEADLESMYRYIAQQGFPENAKRFADALTDFCLSLSEYPNRGRPYEDVRPGLRVLGFNDQAKIAFAVRPVAQTVAILRILGRRQSVERAFGKRRS